jgi:cell division protease FtsH
MAGADTNKLIDAEIKQLVEGGLKRAQDILSSQEDKLHLIAQALLEYETLTGEEIDQLMKDGKIDRPDAPRGPVVVKPAAGVAVPKAGRKFGGEGAPQGT